MVRIKNLSEAKNQRIRLTPAAGATSDISASTGAIAKDGENILICLAPALPPVIPVDPEALRIIPVSQEFGLSRYYAKGVVRPEANEKIYHDLAADFQWDVIGFGDPIADPITIMPSATFNDLVAQTQWPNPYGYIARDLREMRLTPSQMIIFPAGFVQAVREQVLPTDPTRVVLIEDWVDENRPDGSYNQPVTAAEFIEYVDNGIYGFWFADAGFPVKLTLTLDTGLGEEPAVYRINPVLQETPRWPTNKVMLNQGYNIPGLFTGVDGYGFIEYLSKIQRDGEEEGQYYGGGSQYQDVRANGAGTQITLGSRPDIEATVSPNGDAFFRPLKDGLNNLQFNLLTETDMDLSDRGLDIPGLTCHYMKITAPEHKLFYHRFFFSYTTLDAIACTPSSPVTLVNQKLDIAQGDVIRIAGRLETESGTQVLTGTYTVDSQLLALNALYADDINWFNMGAKFYSAGADNKDTMISPTLASDYPPDFVWHADPRTITYDTCANLGVTLQVGELDFVRDILQLTEPVVIQTCGFVTSS